MHAHSLCGLLRAQASTWVPIVGLIFRLPLGEAGPDGPRAGPPFQMPYTLALPHAERDRWRLHGDILDASGGVLNRLKELGVTSEGQDYLLALAQADEIERGQVAQLIAGAAADTRPIP